MISPKLASDLYEARMKELGGFEPARHYPIVQYVAQQVGATEKDVVDALRAAWSGAGAG